jgi:hypothetical protein
MNSENNFVFLKKQDKNNNLNINLSLNKNLKVHP